VPSPSEISSPLLALFLLFYAIFEFRWFANPFAKVAYEAVVSEAAAKWGDVSLARVDSKRVVD